MQLVMLIGIPASGKSTFYKEKFFNTHMRISMDLFNTRNKESRFFELAVAFQQRIVIDNTNVLRSDRKKYIDQAKAKGYVVIGYFFESNLSRCCERNEGRSGKDRINKVGVMAKYKMLERPQLSEGFDNLYYVRIEDNQFTVNNWNNEI